MTLAQIALLFFGTPYTWGGNNVTTGFDCSGLACECLRSRGYIGKEDYTAQMLHDRLFSAHVVNRIIGPNTLLFFGKDINNITHVAVAIDNQEMCEAAGEGRTETDNGYVRIRPIISRKDFVTHINL